MSETTVKKIARTRKITKPIDPLDEEGTKTETVPMNELVTTIFGDLLEKITDNRQSFEKLLREIADTRLRWTKEQENKEQEMETLRQQENARREREQEIRTYEAEREQQKLIDELADKRAVWEKELREQKETIEEERKELEELRKLTDGFEAEKIKSVEQAVNAALKQQAERNETERRMNSQETKAREEILNLKINNLTMDNTRLMTEIETLRRTLDEATRQVKEIALKVIETKGGYEKSPLPTTQS